MEATTMVRGTVNYQLKGAVEKMAVERAIAMERAVVTATRQCQQWCIDNNNDNNATRKCLWQWLRQLWRQR
jgi:hypothetical protein